MCVDVVEETTSVVWRGTWADQRGIGRAAESSSRMDFSWLICVNNVNRNKLESKLTKMLELTL